MYKPEIIQLHCATLYDLAEKFHDRHYFVFLDSRIDENDLGKFSFISFDPFQVVKSKGDLIESTGRLGNEISRGNPLDKIRNILSLCQVDDDCAGIAPIVGGGGIGYFSYELGRQLELLPNTAVDDLDIPECYFCFYDHLIVYDHERGKLYLSYLPLEELKGDYIEKLLSEINTMTKSCGEAPRRVAGDGSAIIHELGKDAYFDRFMKIKEYILSGDVYQVNFTQRFKVQIKKGVGWELYKNLMRINPAPFACYLNYPDVCVASSSPERFLRLTGRSVETRPIKGTIRRGETPEEDKQFRQDLLSSVKDRAELAMIVDLMRNDIGRVCEIQSVSVNKFPEIESYASVHHLVATITGDLARGMDAVDLLKATFPGGSITGAPKIRAMEIIDELEPVERGIYTGSIGYIGFNGNMDTNIVIRTFVIKGDTAYIQAGGGIVVESEDESEYYESLLKAEKLFRVVTDFAHP